MKNAHQKLCQIKDSLHGETIVFAETMYFVRCGACNRDILGAYYTKLPEEYKCDACGKTTKIKHTIARRPTYTFGVLW